MRLIFDIETNGLLPGVDRLHSLCILDHDSGRLWSCCDQPYTAADADVGVLSLDEGLDLLARAERLVGHNIIRYDLPVLKHLRGFEADPEKVIDTRVFASLVHPRDVLVPKDVQRIRHGTMPGGLLGSNGLEAWGYRMAFLKGDYASEMKARGEDPWAAWNPEMQWYCEQDVRVTRRLLVLLLNSGYPVEVVRVEQRIEYLCKAIEEHGFRFDEAAAAHLYAKVCDERAKIEQDLKDLFPPWIAPKGRARETVPKRTVVPSSANSRALPTTEGAAFCPVEARSFNPASRDHIADRLMRLRGWKPDQFTDTGKPEVSETILAKLPYPEARPLAHYLTLSKRAGQIGEGKEAWLRCSKDGRIHHRINPRGTVTRRATHSSPNIAQVPKVGSYLGEDCRALFLADKGFVLVGADMSGIELRMLAHYMAPYDGGVYGRAVVEGTQEDGTDVHTLNCLALGLEPKKLYTVNGKQAKGRDLAKTFVYALLYGAGDDKIAMILGVSKKAAKETKARFLANTPALAVLIKMVRSAAKARGRIKALDGAFIHVRSEHAALNTLLQSAGAIAAKHWMLAALESWTEAGWKWGVDYAVHAWVHDELQSSARPEIADDFGKRTVSAITLAGDRLGVRVPLDGEYKVGANWRDTH